MTRYARRLVLLCVLATLPPAGAQTPPPPSAETQELVAREAMRVNVERLLSEFTAPSKADEDDPNPIPVFQSVAEQLIALGPGVAPFLTAEIEGKSKVDLHLAAYVLGFLNPPGTKEVLRQAAEIAEKDGGEFGRDRKVWLGYSLAVTGDADALDLLDSGKLNAIRKEFFGRVNVIDVASILTAPASRPKLLDRLDRYGADPELADRLYLILHALRRVADPSIVRRITPFLDHDQPYVRDAAARALAATGEPAVVDKLLAKLDDPVSFSRIGIANSIEELRPSGKWKGLLERLSSEEDVGVRSSYYRTIAATGGESAVEPLIRRWGREDGLDRALLLEAIAGIKSKKSLNLMRSALQDPDMRVVFRAVNGLAAVGGPGAVDTLLALLRDPRTTVELEATKALVRLGEGRAVERIAENLRRSIASPLADAVERDAIHARADALIKLHDTSALADVRRALTTQTDPILLEDLRQIEKRLAILDAAKDDKDRWLAALSSADADTRRLAYVRLADLGATSAAGPLVEAFGRVDVAEGAEVLRALGKLASPEAAPLVERVLLDPSFDAHGREPLRAMGAWVARRIGGPKMIDTLHRAADRRNGRDVEVLVQYAVLAGRDALPTLQATRAMRLRFHDWRRGAELERLDRITRDLKAGRSLESQDHPPEPSPS